MNGSVSKEETINVDWVGPCAWPKMNSALPALPPFSGAYLLAVEHRDGYLIYAAGITRRPIAKRIREHTRNYMDGVYTVFDIAAMRNGIRKEIWHGFWMKPHPPERECEFARRNLEIITAVQNQLTTFRLFAAAVSTEPRLLERLEAAIMNCLYAQPSPISDIPDRGMRLTPRLKLETPIICVNHSNVILHGLPVRLEI